MERSQVVINDRGQLDRDTGLRPTPEEMYEMLRAYDEAEASRRLWRGIRNGLLLTACMLLAVAVIIHAVRALR